MKVTLLTTNNEFIEMGFDETKIPNSINEFVDAIRTAKSNNKEINVGVQGDLKHTINASKIDKIQIEVEL